MKKGLLSIHYYFPPMHSIGVLRNGFLNNALHTYFDTHTVLTTSNRQLFGQDHSVQIASNIRQIELPTNDYRTTLAKRNSAGLMHQETQRKKTALYQLAVKTINSWPFNLWQGEGGRTYINNGIKTGQKLIESGEVTHLYSSFRPYADHYIAYRLKKRHRELKWIADFRDLHIDPLYKWVLSPSFQRRINKSIFSQADALITVTPGYVEPLKAYHDNVHCIFNGIYQQHPSSTTSTTELTFTYTGSLYGDHRTPAPLLQAMAALNLSPSRCKIIYAGKDGKHFSSFFMPHHQMALLQNHGAVSRTQALQLQAETDVLLLLTSSIQAMQGILTGKFFEYMGAGKPIWLIIDGIRDPYFEELFEKYNLGEIFYHTELEKIKSKLKQYLDLKEKNQLEAIKPDMEAIQRDFSWSHAAEQIMKLC